MNINFSETFPHLSRAPIVEAVIDLRAKPSVQWQQEGFQKFLKEKLPDYPTTQYQRLSQLEFKTEPGKPPEQRVVDLGCTGLLFRPQDKLQVAQFQKEGFAFSRLTPYQKWELFMAEALRLWKIFVEVARPVAIQRIGVRFINRMTFPADAFNLDEYLVGSPQPKSTLGFLRAGFLYSDTLVVPETNYSVNLIRTIQPAQGTPPSIPIILDIDVFTTAVAELVDADIEKRLTEMRWLKNKIFFGNITEKTKGSFQ